MSEEIRVLYAEDNLADADLTRRHFERNAPEFAFDIVDSGQECLARLQRADYDVLLLDNHLPDMDGIDVLQQAPGITAALPVVMVTGVGDEALVVQVLRLGVWDYVPKDANYLRGLPAILKQSVGQFRGRRQEPAATARLRRVLYVESDSADIDLMLKYFAEAAAHFSVEVATSSGYALALLREQQFDLVLVDLRMPDMNALDLLRETKHAGLIVPFIVVTGKGDEGAAVAALRLGAYDYIVKRDNYLTQLPHAIENAIARAELAESNRRLQNELAERQRAEAENVRLLQEVQGQRQRLSEIVASVHGVVWESGGTPGQPGRIVEFISSSVEPMLGYSVRQWLSTPGFWRSIIHPDDSERVLRECAEVYAGSGEGISEFRVVAQDHRVVWIAVRSTVVYNSQGHAVGMRGVAVDITGAKEAEQARAQLLEQLQQAQKMESIGRLAGGVAHDFNNLLTVINGYSAILERQLPEGDPLRRYAAEITAAGERAADLTHQLLAFSRRQLLQPRVLDLNALLQDSVKMLKRLVGEDIELVTHLHPEVGRVRADAGQMHQVILNVAVNARDAMPRGGTLTLLTRNFAPDEVSPNQHPSLKPVPYVMLAIGDTGCGMDEHTLAQVFEPFFTTKEQGKGTGLGLSTVYGIVNQSGGSIEVESELGRGTTVTIFLPRVDEPISAAASEPVQSENPGGSDTILVVEDEESVRKLICRALRTYGYQVVEAAGGAEALQAAELHTGSIPVLITDVVMPEMSGRELADKMRQLYPEMQVLYLSGYTGDEVVRLGLLENPSVFLQKPFTPAVLAGKVRSLLDQRAGPPSL
jgi:PAS domain S-box-containing protein